MYRRPQTHLSAESAEEALDLGPFVVGDDAVVQTDEVVLGVLEIVILLVHVLLRVARVGRNHAAHMLLLLMLLLLLL